LDQDWHREIPLVWFCKDGLRLIPRILSSSRLLGYNNPNNSLYLPSPWLPIREKKYLTF